MELTGSKNVSGSLSPWNPTGEWFGHNGCANYAKVSQTEEHDKFVVQCVDERNFKNASTDIWERLQSSRLKEITAEVEQLRQDNCRKAVDVYIPMGLLDKIPQAQWGCNWSGKIHGTFIAKN